ncbi:Rhomboid protein 2 [Nakaseomyces bracarensis]|uniref:Rhomboid-type serine protease 2 n=1 Tax=Nakaseomyces bracarensis TaxID=273131 RepID=A0ABR4NRM5_9SACH
MIQPQRLLMPEGRPPAALSTGLMIFLTAMFGISQINSSFKDHFVLLPSSLFEFDMGKLSLYPLMHMSYLHLVFNALAIVGPLNNFEATHGTIHTGVVLNLSAVIAAIIYCVVSRFLGLEAGVVGASGWCFTFITYMSVKESRIYPKFELSRIIPGVPYSIPTHLSPVCLLFFTAVVFFRSSFLGHTAGMAVGYFIGYFEKYFNILVPPSWILDKIEKVVDPLINIIPFNIKYYRDAEVDREEEYKSFFPDQPPILPTTGGSGTVLGTA